jgi:hypothetical protein
MLNRGERERRRIHKREKEALKDFDDWGKERDGAVRRTLVKRLAGLRDGDNICLFPYGGEVSVINGEVEKFG